MEGETSDFRCPECGSEEPEDDSLNQPLDPNDPWCGLLPTVRCSQCQQLIPIHLAQRWNNRSWQEAQMEWRQLYRPANH